MDSLAIASITFICTLAGTLVGMLIARKLPDHHLNGASKDAVKQGTALIATLTAMVLGLLVATTKGTFDAQSSSVKEISANVVLLDRLLARYGPESKEARASLASVIRIMLAETWPDSGDQSPNLASTEVRSAGEALFDKVLALGPKNDTQGMLRSRSLEMVISLGQVRQRLLAQKESSIPAPFLFILGFWLTILFGCYGLLSPRNTTVIVVLVICMISVAAALYLVLEMDRPFDGIMQVSSAPLRAALARIGD